MVPRRAQVGLLRRRLRGRLLWDVCPAERRPDGLWVRRPSVLVSRLHRRSLVEVLQPARRDLLLRDLSKLQIVGSRSQLNFPASHSSCNLMISAVIKNYTCPNWWWKQVSSQKDRVETSSGVFIGLPPSHFLFLPFPFVPSYPVLFLICEVHRYHSGNM